jgi:hypothetical protein
MNRIRQYIIDNPAKLEVGTAEPWEIKNEEVKPL